MAIMWPENSIQDSSDFEVSPPTGDLEGLGLAVEDAASNSPTADILMRASNYFFPGQHMTEEQWKGSPYYRKGLNFPNGVGENVAKNDASRHDQELERQDLLNNMKSGFLSDASSFAGSITGTFLDPINAAVGIAVPEIAGSKLVSGFISKALDPAVNESATGAINFIGRQSSALRNKLSAIPDAFKTTGMMIGRVAGGAGEGAAISTPQALSQYDVESQIGMNPSSASILTSIGLGSALGGTVRGVVGFHLPITRESDELAKQTAVNQLSEGKSVNIGDIVQQGAYDQRLKELQTKSAEIPNLPNPEDIDAFNKSIDDNIQKKQAELNEVLPEEQATRFVNGLTERPDLDQPSLNNIDEVEDILKKPGFARSANDILTLNQLPKTEEAQEALRILQKEPATRNASENLYLKALRQNEEKDFITARLSEHETDIQKIDSNLKNLTEKRAPKKFKMLNEQKEVLQQRIQLAQKRLDEIDGKNIKLSKSEKIQQELEKLHYLKQEAQEIQKRTEVTNTLKPENFQRVAASQVKANSDRIQSWRGDSALDETKLNSYDNELKGIPDSEEGQLKQLEERIKGIDLTEKDQKELDEIKEEESNLSVFQKALRNLSNCLKGSL